MIKVTKPFLPPKEEYDEYLKGIWEREWLTNNGPLVKEFEEKISAYLETKNLLFVGNGTIAIQIAIQALDLKGEIITTPFSYVATTSSIVWEHCIPTFVDIDPNTLNIDPSKIEESITDQTSAILATHVFGNPCEIDEIQKIAEKHNLKVIYDAAHCFGTKFRGDSILNYGDISTISFHATKLFNTVEGGAITTCDESLHSRMFKMRNFGHNGPEKFDGVGINGKNSEFHAAMGLTNLKYADSLLEKRKEQYAFYQSELSDLNISFQSIHDLAEYNYSYFPAIFESEEVALKVIQVLNDNEIYPRRYFYPSLNVLNYVDGECPVSESISSRILCLPVYHDLEEQDQHHVVKLIKSTLA